MGLLGKKMVNSDPELCPGESRWVLGVGLGLPVNHTVHLRSGNFRLTSTSKGASKGV